MTDEQNQILELRREVDRQGRLIDELYRQLGLPKADTGAVPGPHPQIVEAIRAGNKIQAIKMHRELTGSGLKESKDAVEALARTLGY